MRSERGFAVPGARSSASGQPAVAQFGVEGVAQGVAEKAETELSQRDRQAGKIAIQGTVEAYSSASPRSISGGGRCSPRLT